MPDRYGFNDMGTELRCVWCHRPFPMQMSENQRMMHAARHAAEREAAAKASAREKALVSQVVKEEGKGD